MELFDYTDPDWPPKEVDLANGDWLTIQQTAFDFKVDKRTVERWIVKRSISIKIGGRVWINRRRIIHV